MMLLFLPTNFEDSFVGGTRLYFKPEDEPEVSPYKMLIAYDTTLISISG